MDKVIISTPGYLKKPAHDRDRITLSVPIDHMIFYFWPYFLSVNCRKSRNRLFPCKAVPVRSFRSAEVVARLCADAPLGVAQFRMPYVLPLCCIDEPSFNLNFIKAEIARYFLSGFPCFAHCVDLCPENFDVCPFLFDMIIPPDVVLSFSYIRGLLSILRFYGTCSKAGQGSVFYISYGTKLMERITCVF